MSGLWLLPAVSLLLLGAAWLQRGFPLWKLPVALLPILLTMGATLLLMAMMGAQEVER